ncbi:hypothetical protein DVS77_23160 [Mycolicibacterium moriokaense]|nr:hypothetical protein DVS77_23160 [Mycolicibacterium moriokaense]
MSATTTKKMVHVAATLIGTAGLLTISYPANAEPRCAQWVWGDSALFLDMAGARVGIPWTKGTSSVRTGNTDARFIAQQFTMEGSAEGGWSPQGSFDVTVHWTKGIPAAYAPNHSNHFLGNLNDLGVPSGWSTDENGVSSGEWSSASPFTCVKREAAPADNTPAQPGQDTPKIDPNGPVVAGTAARVSSDVDVYDNKNEPDGAGTIIGILKVDAPVQLLTDCQKKSWCKVSGDKVPTGSGWIWGALDWG